MSNPKISVLKDGKWATNPPFDDHLVLAKGEIRDDIEEKHVAGLIKYGYVELVEKQKPISQDEAPQSPKPKKPKPKAKVHKNK